MLRCLVMNSARAHAQQTIKITTNILVSTHDFQRPTYELNRIFSLKLSRTLRDFIRVVVNIIQLIYFQS